ncbi:HNH endonuclease [Caulobacter sp. 602-1]|uniref:HNH endonuclease n=1 Tax=Caulobacter sp. 602-1 TaxID=2492472 RepID=UPI000F63BEE9|nr:HNH endonuclease [Caulobacter sp. 602-1]RRN64635.1 hypothetical protein EIK80_11410 [Caulobacter sp. 602-1]
MDHRIRTAHEAEVRFGPVGFCIYCGKCDGKLTDEHIIPDGLGGNLILAESSCVDCARITGQTEQVVLRKYLHNIRGALGIRSKKSTEKLKDFIHTVHVASEKRELDIVPASERSLFMLHAVNTDSHPSLLQGQALTPPQLIYTIVAPDDVEARDGVIDGKFIYGWNGSGDVNPIIRMVMKIAYAYAYAVLPPEEIDTSLSHHILKKPGQDILNVFGALKSSESLLSLHDIQIVKAISWLETEYWLVRLKLFSFMSNAPTYEVVIGRPSQS